MFLNLLEKTLNGCFAVIPRNKPSYECSDSVRVIAHRGAHNHTEGIVENTLAAFDRAKKLGCWGIELDVHSTADKVLVVHHDDTLKRLWKINQSINLMSFKELRALVPDIPSLQEVVQAYGSTLHLFIELKGSFLDEDLLERTLHGLSAIEDYHLLTLNHTLYDSLSRFPKHALLLVASHNNVHKFSKISLKENYGGVLGHYLLMNNKTIKELKAAHQVVGVGMVDSKNSLYRELNRGIPWIFTDYAAQVQKYVHSLNHSDFRS